MYPEVPAATADDIATTAPAVLRADADPADALHWLEEQNLAVAPVRDADGTLVGYVPAEPLAEAVGGEGDDRLAAHVEPLDGATFLSSDASFGAVTDALAAEPFCFVGDRTDPGVVTRVDLNHPTAYVHLYALLFEFETRLRTRIVEAGVDWEERLYPDQLETIEERQAHQEGLEPPRIHYLSVPMLGQVVQRTEALREELGFDSESEAQERFERIVHLRNDVFHPKDIVHTRETAAFSGRDAIAVAEIYEQLRELVNRLGERTERGAADVPRPDTETPPAVWTPEDDIDDVEATPSEAVVDEDDGAAAGTDEATSDRSAAEE
jgi:CBS domain-containing protein